MTNILLLIVIAEVGGITLTLFSLLRELRRANRPYSQKCNTLSDNPELLNPLNNVQPGEVSRGSRPDPRASFTHTNPRPLTEPPHARSDSNDLRTLDSLWVQSDGRPLKVVDANCASPSHYTVVGRAPRRGFYGFTDAGDAWSTVTYNKTPSWRLA